MHWLEKCLDSLLNQTYPNIEILILDNGSKDGSRKWLQDFTSKYEKIRLVLNEKNLGFASAHNIGIKMAKGKFVCLLNQDIILDEQFIANALTGFVFGNTDNARIAAVQSKLCRLTQNLKKTNILDSTGLVILKNRRVISRGQGQEDRGQYEQRKFIFGADGALPLYSKEALEDIKIPTANGEWEYFDEDYFMYKEDVDLAWRFILFGWRTVYIPEAKAWHARGAGESAARSSMAIIKERRKVPSWTKFYSWKNQRLMQVKNESSALFIKHLPLILWKEFRSLLYIIFLEPQNLKAIPAFIMQFPKALRKRSYITRHKRINDNEMNQWFNQT